MTPTLCLARLACAVAAWMPLDEHSGLQEPDGRTEEVRLVVRICRVTAYCDRGRTASGVQSGVGQCAAPGAIPFGSTVYIPQLDRSFVVTDRPARRFRLAARDERVMGGRMMHLMLEAIIAAQLLDVDPFDQPAVEEGKALTRRRLTRDRETGS